MSKSQTTSAERQSSVAGLANEPLPLRHTVRCLVGGCWIIAAIAMITVYEARTQFPAWFGPVFLGGTLCLLGIITFYMWAVVQTDEARLSIGRSEARWLWGLLLVSVLCTSSGHQFAPFRSDIAAVWAKTSQMIPRLKFIHYNLILTAGSQVALIVLAWLHHRGRQRLAAPGLLILAGIMLIPNDDCGNAFNRPWLAWFGASPLMFLGTSVVLLIGYCGLHGLRPRSSAVMMGLINAGILLLGLGHLTRIVW
jgi:hypothetical protein